MNDKACSNRILVTGGDPALRSGIAAELGENGNEVIQAADGAEARRMVEKYSFQLIIADLDLPSGDGLGLARLVKSRTPSIPVILLSEALAGPLVEKALEAGAYDLRTKPINPALLRRVAERALESANLRHAYSYHRHEQPFLYRLDQFVAQSPGMKKVLEQVTRVASSEVTTLLTGETGTGKTLVGGGIHANSPRAQGPIVTVNCAALPENLLESELFGHEKGAFTDAHKSRIGRFQQAHGGTIFLDEIGEMPLPLQAKLLRVLEDRVFYRVGGTQEILVDVRIIAATNSDLEKMVDSGRFRRDLLYRLNVANIHIPPLRERKEDILPLAQRFLGSIGAQENRTGLLLSPEARESLLNHPWPGNIRELKNLLERAVLFCEEKEIRALDLGLEPGPRGAVSGAEQAGPCSEEALFWADTLNLGELEKRAIEAALDRSDWVQKKAAELLGLSESQMTYRLNKLSLHNPNFRARRRRPD